MTEPSDTPPVDPFDQVKQSAAASPASKAGGRRALGEPVAPVPPDAPAPPDVHKVHGRASAAWDYRDANGARLGRVVRFDQPDGGKVVLPQTAWLEGGRLSWSWKAFPEPRPLYGLAELAARPAAPVLIVEGEKTADATRERFPAFVPVTWPGGSKATGKVDWSPLAGRDVAIFPDADDPGRKAGQDVARRVATAGALTVAVVELPAHLPQGWDLADAWPDGFGQAQAEALIAGARAEAQPGGVEWPWGFRMDADGLWYDQPSPNGGKPVPVRISDPFEVVGEARDPDGGGWAVVLRFRDRDGRVKTVPVAKARLASGGAEVRSELASEGLTISPARGKSDKFAIALMEVKAVRRLTLVSATGWTVDRYVLPSEVIGPISGETVLFTGAPGALHYRRAGSLAGWREGVAAKAVGNDLLAFAVSLAFLGPLLRPFDIEGGGVHFRGSSSCGKTTLAHAAGSVWGGGGPLGFGQTWRATANALEQVAYGHNDGLVVLDEIALVAQDEAGAASYSLSSGQAKGRARADGSLRPRPEWRVAILSTGEIGLADHIRASRRGDRPMAGQELRLLDIAADAGLQMGVWQTLHGAPGPAELSDTIKAASGRDYGHAGPAFVAALIARRVEALELGRRLLAMFVAGVAQPGDTGQAQRAGIRFGAIAAAGELATLFGVTGWPPGLAGDAARRLYHRWAAAFGRDRSREANTVLRQVRAVIESEGASFAPWEEDDDIGATEPSRAGRDEQARGLKSWGWRVKQGATLEFRFNDAGWEQATVGFGRADAARALYEAGFLERGEGEHWKKKHSRKGVKLRLWTVKGSILEADLGD